MSRQDYECIKLVSIERFIMNIRRLLFSENRVLAERKTHHRVCRALSREKYCKTEDIARQ